MMGMACCAADESDMAPSTLSSQSTRLTHHSWTKGWAAEAWARHSDPFEQSLSDTETPAQFPSDQLQGLFGQQRKRPARAASTQARSTPSISSAKASMEVGDLGSIMAKILESQAEASLRLH